MNTTETALPVEANKFDKWKLYVSFTGLLYMLSRGLVTIDELARPRTLFVFGCARCVAIEPELTALEMSLEEPRNMMGGPMPPGTPSPKKDDCDPVVRTWRGVSRKLWDHVYTEEDRQKDIAEGRRIHDQLRELLLKAEFEGRFLCCKEDDGSSTPGLDFQLGVMIANQLKLDQRNGHGISNDDPQCWWNGWDGNYPDLSERIARSHFSDQIEVIWR